MVLPDGSSCFGTRPRRGTFVSRVRDAGIGRRTKEVAGASAGMKQGLAGIGINFPAHAIDVNLNQIREGIERLIPHMLGDFGASHNAAAVARKIFEQRILFGGKRHIPAAPGASLRACIQSQVGDGNFGSAKFTRTAPHRPTAYACWRRPLATNRAIRASSSTSSSRMRASYGRCKKKCDTC